MAKKNVAPITKPFITKAELLAIVQRRELLATMKAQQKAEQAILDQMEEDVMRALKAGAEVRGGAVATVVEEVGRCSPKWKEEYLDHMATHGVDPDALTIQVQAKYPPKIVEVLAINLEPGPKAVG